ncbi:MAG: hypothetical protein NTY38_19270 [Acidobacteria bacterium]|nr:hypothetical protein [Acidobacteriota bacterium]
MLLLLVLVTVVYGADPDPVLEPGAAQLPEWARQGRFRFTRLDGGPIEVMKTSRSAWGRHFNEQQKEVLGNLYSKYADQVVDLLAQAKVNWVWITWSVGYSWQEEAAQREQCRVLTAKLHKRGIHVAAYLCAVSMFWESMFRDEPRSTRWLRFDPDGVPYRYSGGKDPLRFIAEIDNPEWVAYQERRLGAAVDAGIDAFFLDNTAATAWGSDEATANYIGKLRRYLREVKRSDALLMTNYGLTPNRIVLNGNMEVVFAEGWREPGLWDGVWECSNIRRTKYIRGVVPEWKPLVAEYSIFHSSDRAHGWLKPRSARLAIAEAAAFDSGYAWDQEGPFDGALMAGDAAAMESWKAIGSYNGFLEANEGLYVGARGVAPVAVLLPGDTGGAGGIRFAWDREESGLFDLLARGSVQYDIRLTTQLSDELLAQYGGVVIPDVAMLTPEQKVTLWRYKHRGGELHIVQEMATPQETVDVIRAMARGRMTLEVEGPAGVLGQLTRLGDGQRMAIQTACGSGDGGADPAGDSGHGDGGPHAGQASR